MCPVIPLSIPIADTGNYRKKERIVSQVTSIQRNFFVYTLCSSNYGYKSLHVMGHYFILTKAIIKTVQNSNRKGKLFNCAITGFFSEKFQGYCPHLLDSLPSYKISL